MATKISVQLQDDLDGSEATETVSFGLDGQGYEIDLNDKNAIKLREVFGPYTEHARRRTDPRPSRTRRNRPGVSTGHTMRASAVNPNDVREWAKSQGLEVKDRGRVPAELVVKFQAAQQG